jgi:predicted nucleic acid-binding protein
MAWCFEDEMAAYPRAVLETLSGTRAVAPSIWPLEVANAVVVAERRGRVVEADVIRFIALIEGLPVGLEEQVAARVLHRVMALAREQGLSSYDAAYLDLAMRRGLPIATLDVPLRQAAGRVGVPVWQPGEESA